MNTQITLATVEANLRAKITANCGGKLIVVSEGALQQMGSITDMIVTESKFDIDALTPEHLQTAQNYVDMFDKANLNGEVVDGVLMPISDTLMNLATEATKAQIHMFTPGATLSVYLVNKVIQDVKQFTR